jgi:hypothetical protein
LHAIFLGLYIDPLLRLSFPHSLAFTLSSSLPFSAPLSLFVSFSCSLFLSESIRIYLFLSHFVSTWINQKKKFRSPPLPSPVKTIATSPVIFSFSPVASLCACLYLCLPFHAWLFRFLRDQSFTAEKNPRRNNRSKTCMQGFWNSGSLDFVWHPWGIFSWSIKRVLKFEFGLCLKFVHCYLLCIFSSPSFYFQF